MSTTQQDSNPFANAEPWDVQKERSSAAILGKGGYVCRVTDVDQEGENRVTSRGNPQFVVQLADEGSQGEIRDWIVVNDKTIRKVAQLTDAAGIRRPKDIEVTPEGPGYRFSDDYLKLLIGQRLGVWVDEEPKRDDPTQMRSVIASYDKPASPDDTIPF
jgi:hypothetical protein